MATMKETEGMKMVNDENEIVSDFTRRTPFWDYRSISYRDFAPLMNLKEELDKHLEELFKNELDDGNANVLDCIIFDRVRQALEDLKSQSVRHEDMNCSFENRADSDVNAFREERDNLLKDLEYLREKYRHLIELFEACEYKEDK